MAEIPFATGADDPAQAGASGNVVNWAGAIVSLALVAGACVWGYKLLVRDVSGVPVVRALEGPMRVAPENPGGRPAENQGLAVNKVAADGAAEKPADRLVLAPPPIDLTEADAAVTRTSAPAVESEELVQARAEAASDEIVAPPPLSGEAVLTVEQLAAQLAAGADPLTGTDDTETPPVRTALAEVEAEVEETPAKLVIKGGIKRSLRPVLRPEGLSVAREEVQLASVAPIDAAPSAVDDDDIPAGTRMVQLGAFATPEIAAAEWDKLAVRFEDFLGDKTRVIQKAQSGGRVFYRLRAMGFADVSDARRLCSALKAENADCIPVTTR